MLRLRLHRVSVARLRLGSTRGRRRTQFKIRLLTLRVASYIAKYIAKAFIEGVAGSNRWTKFGECEVPKPVDLGKFPHWLAVLEGVYALVDKGATVVDQHLSRWGDWFFLVVENQDIKKPG